jgi:nanoRNase/pAp phosphatase (c-di-AMP/oligoRNAs hydrolase)
VHIVTTHKGTDFDALASVVAANLLYPGIVTVLPGSLNPNVQAFVSLHKDLFGFCSRSDAVADLYGLCLLGDNLATGCKQNRFCFNSPADPRPAKVAGPESKK